MPYSHKQHYSSPRRGSVMGVDRMVGRGWGKRPTSLLALRCIGGQRSLNACCIIFTRTTAKRGHSGSGCHKWRRGSIHKGRKRPWTPHQPYLGRAMTNHAKHAGAPKSSPALYKGQYDPQLLLETWAISSRHGRGNTDQRVELCSWE